MATEFFTDVDIDSMQKALKLIIGDLETMRARLHDFSKQRMRKRLEGVQDDLSTVIRILPVDPEIRVGTQSQENDRGTRT